MSGSVTLGRGGPEVNDLQAAHCAPAVEFWRAEPPFRELLCPSPSPGRTNPVIFFLRTRVAGTILLQIPAAFPRLKLLCLGSVPSFFAALLRMAHRVRRIAFPPSRVYSSPQHRASCTAACGTTRCHGHS